VAGVTTLVAATGNGKALWYLTRGTGTVALLLLTAGIVLGVASSLGWRARRLPRFLVSGLHRNVTLLALAFVVVHVATTVVDRFAPIGWLDAVIPFRSPYRPVWLGLGAVAFDLLLALIVTSMLRGRIGVRAWRAVHWLAYASWPVALLHTLGAGSDARAGWLQLVSFGSVAAVALAVAARALAARDVAVRTAAIAGAVGVPIALFVWAGSGPFRPGWAARSGTPARLLKRTVVTQTRSLTAVTTATLPSGSFTASLQGSLHEASDSRGLVVVTIDAAAAGDIAGRVHLGLRGEPLAGGGVQLIDSVVGVLPRGGAAWYSGSVTGLEGQRVVAEVSANGTTVPIVLDLQIDGSSVTGTLHGGARLSDEEANG
jgi:sulfoxide reductase heme-binding subunit YedZ